MAVHDSLGEAVETKEALCTTDYAGDCDRSVASLHILRHQTTIGGQGCRYIYVKDNLVKLAHWVSAGWTCEWVFSRSEIW